MNIVIIGPAHPYRGGLAMFNERLALEFQNQGHQVEIYTFTLQYPSFLFPGKTQYTNDSAPESLKIERRINSINPLNWIKTGKRLQAKKPDFIIFAYWMAFMAPCFGTIEKIVRRNKFTKSIGLIHNFIPHEPTILDKLFPHYFVKNTDAFITLSQSVLNDIDKIAPKKPKIFSPHPLYDNFGVIEDKNTACEQLGLDSQERYALFFGFIREYKGLDLLIRALAEESLKDSEFKVIVAGEFYSNAQFYQNLIDDLKVREKLILRTDFIPQDQVRLYFSACDIVVQTYKTATQSGVTQIAYHFNKPMLVTDVGGLAEIVPHEKVGYVVKPDPQNIAAALFDFFEKSRGEEFRKNMTVEKEKYSWKEFVKEIFCIFANDLGR